RSGRASAFDVHLRRQTRRTRRTLWVPIAERTREASLPLAWPSPALLPETSRLRVPCRAWLPNAQTETPCTLQTPSGFAGRPGQHDRRQPSSKRQTGLYTVTQKKRGTSFGFGSDLWLTLLRRRGGARFWSQHGVGDDCAGTKLGLDFGVALAPTF